jgi:hypothetical protein
MYVTNLHPVPARPQLPAPLRRSLLPLLSSALAAIAVFAQPQAELDLEHSPAALENKHVRAVRLSVPAQSAVSIRRLAFESLLVSLCDAPLQMTPQAGTPQRWQAVEGSLLWVRGNFGFSLENSGNAPAELLSLELRDSYAFNQLSAPRSAFDPVLIDPGHFRVAFENEHVRALLIHFGPREESPQAQFSQGLSISLAEVHASHILPNGEHAAGSSDAGAVAWQPQGLYSIHNLDPDPLDSLYIEFKHPFCYSTAVDWFSGTAESRAFILSVVDKVKRRWLKVMPQEARSEKRGLVTMDWKIQPDGSVREDDMVLNTVFASDALVEAARLAIRKAAPFPNVPSSLDKPNPEVRFVFLYNLPVHPPGCD